MNKIVVQCGGEGSLAWLATFLTIGIGEKSTIFLILMMTEKMVQGSRYLLTRSHDEWVNDVQLT